MGRSSAIKWTPSDEERLRKTVRNFNDKIRRLEKKNPALYKNKLPEKLTAKDVKELKEQITTRQDFNREIRSLQRFSRKGAEDIVDVPGSKYNLKTTRWQKNEMARRTATINRVRESRYETVRNIQAQYRGEKLGYTLGEIGMRSVDERAVEPLKAFFPSMRKIDLDMRLRHLRKESMSSYWGDKEKFLRENMIKGIKANYGDSFSEDVDRLIEEIEKLSFKDFYEKFISEPGEMEIVSPPPGATMDDMLKVNMEVLKSTWLPNYKSPMAEEVGKVRSDLLEKIKNKGNRKR